MLTTLDTSQDTISQLNSDAPSNMWYISVTRYTSRDGILVLNDDSVTLDTFPKKLLNSDAGRNIYEMSLTLDTFQDNIRLLNDDV